MPSPEVFIQDLNPLGSRISFHVPRRAAGARALLPARRPALAGELGRGGRGGRGDPARRASSTTCRSRWPARSFVYGMAFGLLPIGWTVFGAMLLYNLTVETGQFTIIRRSIGGLSGDARVQAVLIGFCFGAFMEGAAGAGSPVAICGAMLVGLGVPPFRAAVICLIANTSPVCYGGLGMPVLTLARRRPASPADDISIMCGHQLPFLSCLIPLTWSSDVYLAADARKSGRPCSSAAGRSPSSSTSSPPCTPGFRAAAVWPLTDIGGGIFSLITLALFLKFVWKPKDEWKFPTEADPCTGRRPTRRADRPARGRGPRAGRDAARSATSMARTRVAADAGRGHPGVVAVRHHGGLPRRHRHRPADGDEANGPTPMLGFVQSYYADRVPTLHKQVERADRLQKPGATDGRRTPEKADLRTSPG